MLSCYKWGLNNNKWKAILLQDITNQHSNKTLKNLDIICFIKIIIHI